jgi:hypothetical protein
MLKKLSLLVALALIATFVFAQEAEKAPKKTPESETVKVDPSKVQSGIIEFSQSKVFAGITPKVEVSLDRGLLSMLQSATENTDPDFAKLVNSVDMIRIQVFENNPDKAKAISGNIEGLVEDLKAKQGWSSLVRVREDREKVDILVRNTPTHITGIGLFVQESNELVFINIAGKFDSKELGKTVGNLMGKFANGSFDPSEFTKLLAGTKTAKKAEAKEKAPKMLVVEGVVKDKKTGKVIEGAMAYNGKDGPNPANSIRSNAEGVFRYETDRSEQIIIVSAPGYKNKKALITPDMMEGKSALEIQFDLEAAK